MSKKGRYMGKDTQQRISELAVKAVHLYGGEMQRQTSERLSFNDALVALIASARPDLLDDAEKLLKGKSK